MNKKNNKKVLFAANLESFFTKFLIPQLKYFKDKGYEVHIAAKSENIDIPYCDKVYDVDFARGFNIKQNINSYKQMKKIFSDNHYDIVSCHTPFGGAITRLAYKNCKIKNTKMIYMAHGFHFYKGASLLHWMLFYPVEKYLAKYTDKLITINLEDYETAKAKFKTDVYYVHGVGIDEVKFKSENVKYDFIKKDDFVLMFPGELNKNKNQKLLIKVVNEVKNDIPNIKLLLPGRGDLKECYENLIKKYELEDKILLLGFRNDISSLLQYTNIAVSSSLREGLGLTNIEAMYQGIPIIAVDNRGSRTIVKDGINGFLVKNDVNDFKNKVLEIYNNYNKYKKNSEKMKKESNKYLEQNVMKEIIKIYGE